MQVRMEPEQVIVNYDEALMRSMAPQDRSDMRVSVSQAAPGPPFRTYAPTRSQNSRFQQVGFAYTEDKTQHLPVYGRRAPRNPNRWNYYTSVNGSEISIGLKNGDRECLADVGCDELQSGDTVSAQELQGDLSIKMYDHAQH
jgi:hypothetical protein